MLKRQQRWAWPFCWSPCSCSTASSPAGVHCRRKSFHKNGTLLTTLMHACIDRRYVQADIRQKLTEKKFFWHSVRAFWELSFTVNMFTYVSVQLFSTCLACCEQSAAVGCTSKQYFYELSYGNVSTMLATWHGWWSALEWSCACMH